LKEKVVVRGPSGRLPSLKKPFCLLQKAKKNAVFAIIAFFIALGVIIIAKFVGKIKQFSP